MGWELALVIEVSQEISFDEIRSCDITNKSRNASTFLDLSCNYFGNQSENRYLLLLYNCVIGQTLQCSYEYLRNSHHLYSSFLLQTPPNSRMSPNLNEPFSYSRSGHAVYGVHQTHFAEIFFPVGKTSQGCPASGIV